MIKYTAFRLDRVCMHVRTPIRRGVNVHGLKTGVVHGLWFENGG